MGIYAVAAFSFTSAGMFLTGLTAYLLWAVKYNRKFSRTALIITTVGILSFAIYFAYTKDNPAFNQKYNFNTTPEMDSAGFGKYPSLKLRGDIWKYYSSTIMSSSAKKIAFGQKEPPDRAQYPSAHNYYLDLAYNFGIVSVIPFMALIWFTVYLLWRERRTIFSCGLLTGLAFTVLFFTLADNNLKVSFRQPYSGILTFFLWGFLIKVIQEKSYPEIECNRNQP